MLVSTVVERYTYVYTGGKLMQMTVTTTTTTGDTTETASETLTFASYDIYISGILLFGGVALASDQDYVPEISYDEADVAYGPPSPNNDDDDDDYDKV